VDKKQIRDKSTREEQTLEHSNMAFVHLKHAGIRCICVQIGIRAAGYAYTVVNLLFRIVQSLGDRIRGAGRLRLTWKFISCMTTAGTMSIGPDTKIKGVLTVGSRYCHLHGCCERDGPIGTLWRERDVVGFC